jgi:hypothetical protein
VALVAARLGSAPNDLEARLRALDRADLRALLHSLAGALERTAFEALLPR